MCVDWDIRRDQPLVSVVTATYNHVDYIRECIESILNQNVDFPFEYLVHDDASTDGTTEIVREYAERYPHVIVPIFQEENQYSQGMSIFSEYLACRARGEFIAVCEGDDFWHDPNKLRIQVDYLREHADVGLVCSDRHTLHQGHGRLHRNVLRNDGYRYPEYKGLREQFVQVLNGDIRISTLTVCARIELVQKVLNDDHHLFHSRHFRMGDLPLWAELALLARFEFIDRPLGTYRRLAESASNTTRQWDKMAGFILSGVELISYLCRKHGCDLREVRSGLNQRVDKLWFALVRSGDATCVNDLRSYLGEFNMKQRVMFAALRCRPCAWSLRVFFDVREFVMSVIRRLRGRKWTPKPGQLDKV
jgi:glycosyltransferase involved in cell wall biosynthesis